MNDAATGQLGNIHIRVLGRTDYMEPEHLAMVAQLPSYMTAEGVAADVFFHEPGGMGAPPLDSIMMYVGEVVATGVAYDLAKASLTGAIKWARERIRRQPSEHRPPEGWHVRIREYGPKGELLSMLTVTETSLDFEYLHPDLQIEEQ